MNATLVAFGLGLIGGYCGLERTQLNVMIRTKEPLQISDADDGGCYILPAGTVLYWEDDFPEGHSLYWTPFYHKGQIEHEVISLEPKHGRRLVSPLWLINLDTEER